MIKTFSFRIKDSNKGKVLNNLAKSANTVWNFCNETQIHALSWNKFWPTAYDLQKLTSGSGKDLGLHSQTVQAVCEEYATRRKSAKKRKLRWRGKRSLGWIPFKKAGIKVVDDTVKYAGTVFRFWKSREIGGQIRGGSFAQDAQDRWYVNITCEVEVPQTTGTRHIGIDLGLKDFAAMSDGAKVEAKQIYRKLEEKLGKAQRAKKKRQVKKIHAKIKNTRKDFLHKLSTKLVRENELIVVGNVNSSGLAKTKMAKSVLDSGWSLFRTLLEYKAIAQNVVCKVVNEACTSQACSECAALSGPRGLKDLGLREWVCCECGSEHDRDTNAALNILALGHESLALK